MMRGAAALLLAALAAAPALALFKTVGPDGRVTYSDRPPPSGSGQVTPLGVTGTAPPSDAVLPPDLRQTQQRHPVTLYSSTGCRPCDEGRRLLQQRGIPFAERQVLSEEDAQALERLMGGRTVPALTIGAQPLRGFSEPDWHSYLDVAGYPRESRLPRDWKPAAPQPLVPRAANEPVATAAPPGDRPAPQAAPPVAPVAPSTSPPGIRF